MEGHHWPVIIIYISKKVNVDSEEYLILKKKENKFLTNRYLDIFFQPIHMKYGANSVAKKKLVKPIGKLYWFWNVIRVIDVKNVLQTAKICQGKVQTLLGIFANIAAKGSTLHYIIIYVSCVPVKKNTPCRSNRTCAAYALFTSTQISEFQFTRCPQ